MRARESNPERIREAVAKGRPISRLLVREGALPTEVQNLVDQAAASGVPISLESEREMRRMSEDDASRELIAVLGSPPARSVEELMSQDGLVLMLVGLRYPSNVGFILRSAEVAGAAGVVVANDWSETEWAEAHRVSIRAERFFPVLARSLDKAESIARAATAAGRSVVALETTGETPPWQADLSGRTLVVLGSETLGVPQSVLALADTVVRIPTKGFIPSYNVQAATGMLLGEWLRQSQNNSQTYEQKSPASR